jgi:hypothetical protein
MTPWQEFEHRMVNMFPQNPTQTAYLRFQKQAGELPPTDFDKRMGEMERGREEVFRTHYLDLIREPGDNDRGK